MEFLINHYQWIFSGIGVLILGWLFTKKRQPISAYPKSHGAVNVVNNIGNVPQLTELVTDDIHNHIRKEDCRLLFIDDNHADFKMVSILKKAGWVNTKAIKDLTDLDDHKAVEASIIFVDINGVGTHMFKDQGLGLAAALKEKYPQKKVILYSAEPTGDRFDKKLKVVDGSLPKNAEPYEFISLIDSYSKNC